MTSGAPVNRKALHRFRGYLHLLAEVELHRHPQFQRKFDPSDLVQETLLKAHRAIAQFHGTKEAELASWLRRILARSLANALRDLQCERRDIRRERSLEEALGRSSVRLEHWVTSGEPTPKTRAAREETILSLARALGELPPSQREALLLHHWCGLSLAETCSRMQRSRSSVAGLVRRALKSLRRELQDCEEIDVL